MGFQYTPVLSIATCVQPAASSQSRKRSRSAVMVRKVRISFVTFPVDPGTMRHAVMNCLWTSTPQQRS
jgi:hypothetical protein